MKLETLLAQIALGEDSSRQFKADVKNAGSLASEMAASVNAVGMVISGHFDPTNDLLSTEAAA
jgi:ATP-dependent DNA helicase RecG